MASSCSRAASVYHVKAKQVQLAFATKILDLLSVQKGNSILDIGCGTGNLVELIAEKVGPTGRVVGVDPDPDRIATAREKCQRFPNVFFNVCRSVDFPYDLSAPYDHCITTTVLHWINTEEKIRTFSRVYDSLKSGGTFAGNMVMRNPTNTALMYNLLEGANDAIEGYRWREGYEWLKQQLLDTGFESLLYEQRTYCVNVGPLDEWLEWLSATLHGRYDLRTAYHTKGGDKISWLKDDDGVFQHDSEQAVFLVRKP